jgi:hypothetical protein
LVALSCLFFFKLFDFRVRSNGDHLIKSRFLFSCWSAFKPDLLFELLGPFFTLLNVILGKLSLDLLCERFPLRSPFLLIHNILPHLLDTFSLRQILLVSQLGPEFLNLLRKLPVNFGKPGLTGFRPQVGILLNSVLYFEGLVKLERQFHIALESLFELGKVLGKHLVERLLLQVLGPLRKVRLMEPRLPDFEVRLVQLWEWVVLRLWYLFTAGWAHRPHFCRFHSLRWRTNHSLLLFPTLAALEQFKIVQMLAFVIVQEDVL